ncbi:MAG: hypothetical protein M3Y26_07750 [Actinomycetota bacterium]|nr:hypothetical protein [Actinomycetota bacterium]
MSYASGVSPEDAFAALRDDPADATTDAGMEPASNVVDGFEGPNDAQGPRSVAGWKPSGLPWRQG